MLIASWNVNSLRVRLPHVQDWLNSHSPDVLGLQEIKLVEEKFPAAELEACGYHSAVFGQPTYNGVALLSRQMPEDVIRGLPGFEDEQRRVIGASYGEVRVLNLYVPNGQSVGSDKYAYKLAWLEALAAFLEQELARYPKLVVMGDFNIAPDDRDVHDPEAWRDKILCSEPERRHLSALLDLGLQDSFRLFEQTDGSFSWWDYRAAGFRRKHGLRIDLLLVSRALAGQCRRAPSTWNPADWNVRPTTHRYLFD